MKEKISVQLIGFASVEALMEAVNRAAKQNMDAELEFIVCDPERKLEAAALEQLGQTHTLTVCADEKDPYGILAASGDYIAICEAGYDWRCENKLRKQLELLNGHGDCMLAFHDVELLKENGYPVDQDVRNRYLRDMSFEERRYGMEQLQRFDNCGFFGTWMLRNIFKDEQRRQVYAGCKLDRKLCLLTMLVAAGGGLNLYDDRMVSCQPDQEASKKRTYPVYGAAQTQAKLEELDAFCALLKEHYGVEADRRYRLLHIANGAFNNLVESEVTEQSVKVFLDVYEKAYRPEYQEQAPESAEKGFCNFLQIKVARHMARKGSKNILPLTVCLDGMPAEEWIRSISECRNRAVKQAMRQRYEAFYETSAAKELRKKTPVCVFFGKVKRKLSKIWGKVKGIGRKIILRRMRKKGYSEYMSREWYGTVLNNLVNDKQTPLKLKLWCYRRGFMPWRIHQYELTEDNFLQYPSDRDYMYLHQMNNSYKKWIEDKMTFRLVLDPFKQHLPKYYYQIIQRDDKQLILKLSDCPEGYEATFDELFRLLRKEGRLALKAASGTHGVGFYKMAYEDGKYYLNNEETTEFGIRKVIKSFRSYYIVTEYINMHDDIKNIFAGSVNTIRVMMINRDGHHPQLMDAYMRIGSEKSGVTDNVAFGGVVCSVDLETGAFGNGLQIVNHVFVPIANHPDTGAPLEGVIPNWEIIKKGLIDISQYMGQLEYLGFDVVCTPEGFVLLEVNSHQDLHRLRYYDQRVRDFFFYKLRRKERRYKIKRKYKNGRTQG